jgi:cysteinyl-tRNA synthetase
MSKSLGNFYTLRDLQDKGYKPEVVRYLLASVPYRKKLNFTFDGLDAANTAIHRLRNFKTRLTSEKLAEGSDEGAALAAEQALRQFEEALDDDLNTAEALGVIFEFVREANTSMDEGRFREENRGDAMRVLDAFDRIFDVLNPSEEAGALSDAEINEKIAERNAARKSRDFQKSDEIRAWLLEKGVVLEDTRDGVRWKRK